MRLIFEKSRPGRAAALVPECDLPEVDIKRIIDPKYLRADIHLPEVAEIDLIRHYTALSRRNFGVDCGFYPLGSCTMKYNPKINEDMARLDGFTGFTLMLLPSLFKAILTHGRTSAISSRNIRYGGFYASTCRRSPWGINAAL